MLACTALVGCTNEDELLNEEQQPTTEKSNAFMSVKLIMTESTGGRATTDGGYDKGSEAEQAIVPAKSIFLFYDAQNKYVASGDLQVATNVDNHKPNSSTHQGDSYGENYVDINDVHGDAYIAISASNDDIKKITKVLTVVNYHNVAELDKLDLGQVLAKIATEQNNPSKAGFLMTTSVYYDGENLVNTTAVDANTHIKATQTEAEGSPVEIYIERASAKVEVLWNGAAISKDNNTLEIKPSGENSSTDPNKTSDLLVDGNLTSASIQILGWRVNNVNENTYLVKQTLDAWKTNGPVIAPAATDGGTATYFTNWNNKADHRSYWAMSTNWNMTAGNVVGTGDANGKALVAYTFNNALPNNGTTDVAEDDRTISDPMYCYEQTVATPDADRDTPNPNVTTVLIAAKIKVQVPVTTTTDGKTTTTMQDYNGDLFKYAGVIYTETGYKNIILQKLADAGYTKTDANTALEAGDIEINSNNTLAGITVTVKAGTYFLNKEESSKAAVDAHIASLPYTNAANVEGYKTGYCYYQIPIEHLSSAANAPFYGVVRNHWYKLDVTAVTHIGEAVYNPEKEIPQIPPQDVAHYLAARIHVLSWHVVKQNVTLD